MCVGECDFCLVLICVCVCGVFGKKGVYLNIYIWSYVQLSSVDSDKLKSC